MSNIEVNKTNVLNKKLILIEYDAGYISPNDEHNSKILRESKDMSDYSKPFEYRWFCRKHHIEHHIKQYGSWGSGLSKKI
jgi:hypothetical protein